MTPVNPSDVRRWMRRSHQRKIDLMKVRGILDLVESGQWPKEQTRMIVRDGVLLDGHHRALAILMHGGPLDINLEIRGET